MDSYGNSTMSKAAELANLIGNINAGSVLGNRNLFINGAVTVSQRNGTSAAQTGNNYAAMPDMFRTSAYATSSYEQSTDAPAGFTNSLKVNCNNSTAPPGGSNTYRIECGIEGQNIAHLLYGTSDAKTCTLSFYVKGSVTGTYSVAFVNKRPGNASSIIASQATRSHIKTYTINSANTWEYKSVTLPGCPDGTWGTSNSDGISIVFGLGSGSDHHGAANTWLSTSDTEVSNQTIFGSNNGGTWQVTGIQFEIGQNGTDFEHEPYEKTLKKCQRYFYKFGGQNAFEHIPGIGQGNASTFNTHYLHPVPMRTAPSINLGGDWRINDTYLGSYFTFSGVAIDNATTLTARIHGNTSGTIGSDLGRILAYGDINAKWEHSAEM